MMTDKQLHKRMAESWTYITTTYGPPWDTAGAYEDAFKNLVEMSYARAYGTLRELVRRVFDEGYVCDHDTSGAEYVSGMHNRYYRADLPVSSDKTLQRIKRLIS